MARLPISFNGFTGQKCAINRIRRLIDGAKKRGAALRSLLLHSSPGTGKTALGHAIANDFGTILHYHQAGPETDFETIFSRITQLKHGDVFFVDEAHSLRVIIQEYFYLPLDERKVSAVGKKTDALVSLADLTLICATSMPSRLTPALCGRLLDVGLEPYRFAELRAIALQAAKEQSVEITPQAATNIAETAAGTRDSQAGTPRGVRRLVEEIILNYPEHKTLGLNEVQAVFTRIGIRDGLWPAHREYLSALNREGGICSLDRLTIRKDRKYIFEEIEPLLEHRGLIKITDRGRVLTAKGAEAIQKFADQSACSDTVAFNEDI